MGYTNSLDTGALWWEGIAGPARLVAGVEAALADGQSIVCNVTTALSFRWVFRDTVGHWLSVRNVMVEHIDCDHEYAGEDITDFSSLLTLLTKNDHIL